MCTDATQSTPSIPAEAIRKNDPRDTIELELPNEQ